jgi:very-short-patch-repair endonuclease
MSKQKEPHGWATTGELWERLKPEARRMRHAPTPSEELLWQRLRNRQLLELKFRRQHPVGRFIVDFYCAEAKLVIEVDGAVHKQSVEEDAIRQRFLEELELRVLRFTNSEVDGSIESVLQTIKEAVLSNDKRG